MKTPITHPAASVDARLEGLHLRTAKVPRLRGEGQLQELKRAAGEALEMARAAAQIEPKAMAETMHISHSLVLRGLKSQADLGFHRLWTLSDTYWLELIVAIAKQRGIAIVRTSIEIPQRERSA